MVSTFSVLTSKALTQYMKYISQKHAKQMLQKYVKNLGKIITTSLERLSLKNDYEKK